MNFNGQLLPEWIVSTLWRQMCNGSLHNRHSSVDREVRW